MDDNHNESSIIYIEEMENVEIPTMASSSNAVEVNSGNDFAPSETYMKILVKYFGHTSFRPLQLEILNYLLKDKRDVCAVMATGYGKSLCYQFPSVYLGGITLVISPLISLMQDQIAKLKLSGIPACLLGSAQTQKDLVRSEILHNKYPLVYLSPELCSSDAGTVLLQQIKDKQLQIDLIAIDEAHCISQWGHDFRKDYTKLGVLRKMFPDCPMLALTATATQRVRNEIGSSLHLRHPAMVYSGFDRPNLYFSVHPKSNSTVADLRQTMVVTDGRWSFGGSTIIYCVKRATTERVVQLLGREFGLKCVAYHAGMSLTDRRQAHEQFMLDEVDAVVATIAFGMGIDKPDVRNVIHYGCSGSVEAYYQEVGRAGRDGLPAKCVCFYSAADITFIWDLFYKNPHESTKAMIYKIKEFLDSADCRRQFILNYFEDPMIDFNKKPDNCCDNCFRKNQLQGRYLNVNESGLYDFTTDATTLLTAISALKCNFGFSTYLLFLKGSLATKVYEFRKHPLHGAGKSKSDVWWKALSELLIEHGYLEEEHMKTKQHFSYKVLKATFKAGYFLGDTNKQLLLKPNGQILRLLTPTVNTTPKWITSKPLLAITNNGNNERTNQPSNVTTIFSDGISLYNLLLKKRELMSHFYKVMPYLLASNRALMEMANLKPTTLMTLRDGNLNGFSELKVQRFGEDFLDSINSFVKYGETKKYIQTVREALLLHPLIVEDTSNATCDSVYNLYSAGKNIEAIANDLQLSTHTAIQHLLYCLQIGRPIKLCTFGVTNDIFHAIKSILDHHEIDVLTDELKSTCPLNINATAFEATFHYVKIRYHLRENEMEFSDFDNVETAHNYQKETLDDLLAFCDDLQNEPVNNPASTSSSQRINCNNFTENLEESMPVKKVKLNSIQCESVNYVPPIEKTEISVSNNNLKPSNMTGISRRDMKLKAKYLPPWFK